MVLNNEKILDSMTPSILKRILSINMVFSVIILIDFISYGRLLFSPGFVGPFNFEILSQNVFYLANIFSQIIFTLFTKIEYGQFAGSITENVFFIKKMQEIILKEIEGEDEIFSFFISNFIPLLFFSTLLFGILSYLLAYFNISKILKIIPKETLNAFIIGIGIFQIYVALDCLIVDQSTNFIEILGRKINSSILSLMVVHGTLLFFLDIYFEGHYLVTPLFSFFSTIFLFFISFLFLGEETFSFLQKKEILQKTGTETVFYYKDIFTAFLLKNFRWNYFKGGIFTAISMAIMSLIHLPVNYSTYKNCLPKNSERSTLKRELITQGFANIILSIFCIPQYLVSSYSIIYSKIGGNSKLISMSLLFSLIPVFYISKIILPYFPKYIYSAIPFMFGLFFIKEGLNDFLLYFKVRKKDNPINEKFTKQCKCFIKYEKIKLDSFYFYYFTFFDIIMLISVLFLFLYFDSNPLIALSFGLIISYLYSKIFIFEKEKQSGKVECEQNCIFNYEDSKKMIYWEPTIITYYNIMHIENTVGAVNLAHCKYIDWYSRMKLLEKTKKGELLVFIESEDFVFN